MTSSDQVKISKNTAVSIGLVVMLLAITFGIGGYVADGRAARQYQDTQNDELTTLVRDELLPAVRRFEIRLSSVEDAVNAASMDRWRRNEDMRPWTYRLQQLNPSLRIPDPGRDGYPVISAGGE